MKIVTLFTFIFMFAFISAQQVENSKEIPKETLVEKEPTYEEKMQNALTQLNQTSTKEAYEALATEFIEIGKKEKGKEWLPYYYATYALIKKGYIVLEEGKANAPKPNKELEDVLYYAQKPLNESMKITADNVENYVLQKLLYQLRKQIVPAQIYQTGGPLALQILSVAFKLDPQNPRVLMLKGEDSYFTSKEFGGDKDKGIDFYKKALVQFDAYKPKSKNKKPIPFYPTWGKEEVEKILATISK